MRDFNQRFDEKYIYIGGERDREREGKCENKKERTHALDLRKKYI